MHDPNKQQKKVTFFLVLFSGFLFIFLAPLSSASEQPIVSNEVGTPMPAQPVVDQPQAQPVDPTVQTAHANTTIAFLQGNQSPLSSSNDYNEKIVLSDGHIFIYNSKKATGTHIDENNVKTRYENVLRIAYEVTTCSATKCDAAVASIGNLRGRSFIGSYRKEEDLPDGRHRVSNFMIYGNKIEKPEPPINQINPNSTNKITLNEGGTFIYNPKEETGVRRDQNNEKTRYKDVLVIPIQVTTCFNDGYYTTCDVISASIGDLQGRVLIGSFITQETLENGAKRTTRSLIFGNEIIPSGNNINSLEAKATESFAFRTNTLVVSPAKKEVYFPSFQKKKKKVLVDPLS